MYWSEKSSCGSEFWSNGDQSKEVTATSRRQLEICTLSFKVRMVQKSGYREAYERRHGIPEQSDTDFKEVPRICTVFHCLDIFGYENNVFTTKHFHRFIHYVLDLFLGLHRTLSYVMD